MSGVKRGRLTVGRLWALFVVGVLAVLGLVRSASDDFLLMDAGIRPKNERVHIIIDAGHGGVDGGAIGANNEIEKDINLSIATYTAQFLRMSGFEVTMIRETDISLHDSTADTIRKKKVSDLKNRLAIINERENSITVSIHQNIYSQSKYKGAQLFYGVQNPESSVLAEMLKGSIVEKLQPENDRVVKAGTKSVYLLMYAENPMALVECGFLSNPEEAQLLTTEEYQKKMAFAIYGGIADYIQITKNQSVHDDQIAEDSLPSISEDSSTHDTGTDISLAESSNQAPS